MPLTSFRMVLLVSATLLAAAVSGRAQAPARKPVLHASRETEDDLEITGMVQGLRPGVSVYIRYADLLAMPQTHATVTGNPDYPGPPLHVAGVLLETLSRVVHPLSGADLVDALCADRYRSPFPYPYMATHHPILVLTIDGKPLAKWAVDRHHWDPGPYLVMYSGFKPAFRILSHDDKPQLPDNLIRLNWTTQASTFGAIAPLGDFAPGSPEQVGFTIAKQNCLRCHYRGASGGTKSGLSWSQISIWAREQPVYFQRYVHNPQAIDPHAHMEAQPEYDHATLEALTAYFRTFTSDPGGTGR